jgi:hypothetical protein
MVLVQVTISLFLFQQHAGDLRMAALATSDRTDQEACQGDTGHHLRLHRERGSCYGIDRVVQSWGETA